jgi:hypothetical protein
MYIPFGTVAKPRQTGEDNTPKARLLPRSFPEKSRSTAWD